MENSRIYSKIIYGSNPEQELLSLIKDYNTGNVFLATEETVDKIWISKYDNFFEANGIKKITVPAGEHNKKIDSVSQIWAFLSKNGADRKSLLINIGGGMLTDLAAFAATTFKRGIDFVNVPTTLLSQVDASVGGKTGINFNGLKNEIGTFKEPVAVLINTNFLQTIDPENFLSGFAEMIKHGLIYSPEHLKELEIFDFNNTDYCQLEAIICHSVDVKKYFVSEDPLEKNIRKALNFGHTIGHAFESMAMSQNRPVLHGYAVAYGMIAELYLSVRKCGFPEIEFEKLTKWLGKLYGKFEISEKDYDSLFELMTHDKKNEGGRINFTLISEVGKIEINQNYDRNLVYDALEFCKSIWK